MNTASGSAWSLMPFFNTLSIILISTEKLGGRNSFMLFTVMIVRQLLFAWKLKRETKGKSLEKLDVATAGLADVPVRINICNLPKPN